MHSVFSMGHSFSLAVMVTAVNTSPRLLKILNASSATVLVMVLAVR